MDKCSREGTYSLLKGRLCQSESFPSASCVAVGKSLYNKRNLKILGIIVIYSHLLINMTYSFRSNHMKLPLFDHFWFTEMSALYGST